MMNKIDAPRITDMMITIHDIHCVSKNDSDLVRYNSDVHQQILIIFGRNVAERIR